MSTLPSTTSSVDTVKRTATGVEVNGRLYPMAESIVATETEIQTAIRNMAQRIALEYGTMTHANTAITSHDNSINNNNKKNGGISHNSSSMNYKKDNQCNSNNTGEDVISLDNPLIILSVLKGAYIFTADFVRYLGDAGLPHVVDFIRLTSYNDGTCSSGQVHVLAKPKYTNLRNKHILVLEDVCDSGRTLVHLRDYIVQHYAPKSVKFCVFMDKPVSARKVKFTPDYSCLHAPNKYIIGYGFEVNDRYRDLRHVFVLKDNEAARFPAKL